MVICSKPECQTTAGCKCQPVSSSNRTTIIGPAPAITADEAYFLAALLRGVPRSPNAPSFERAAQIIEYLAPRATSSRADAREEGEVRLIDRDKIWNLFVGHYWDSCAPQRDLILSHISSVLMMCPNAQPVADGEVERLRERCEAYKGQVEAGAKVIERQRATITQIKDVCQDNARPECDKDLALRFVCDVAVRGLEQLSHSTEPKHG